MEVLKPRLSFSYYEKLALIMQLSVLKYALKVDGLYYFITMINGRQLTQHTWITVNQFLYKLFLFCFPIIVLRSSS